MSTFQCKGRVSTAWNIHAMNRSIDLQAKLREDQAAEFVRSIRSRQDRFWDALDEFKAACPDTWECWYDDDSNIPAEIDWSNEKLVSGIIESIQAEIKK